ncbi:hypothetical protein [Acetanaerobacterium elongatum]|uniref:Uncharacterized protein n=1 Tax=Acetanaerobacterium elongatum TaxID=258515 RepID=A0A1H0BMU5_9FIRM|nr:hypothetical protein [Acetanaerobacterium elongatum]SDN46912.1 hypothetical protein SAMN05192585_1208 [Acetanaerobacterium elongatum]
MTYTIDEALAYLKSIDWANLFTSNQNKEIKPMSEDEIIKWCDDLNKAIESLNETTLSLRKTAGEIIGG